MAALGPADGIEGHPPTSAIRTALLASAKLDGVDTVVFWSLKLAAQVADVGLLSFRSFSCGHAFDPALVVDLRVDDRDDLAIVKPGALARLSGERARS